MRLSERGRVALGVLRRVHRLLRAPGVGDPDFEWEWEAYCELYDALPERERSYLDRASERLGRCYG